MPTAMTIEESGMTFLLEEKKTFLIEKHNEDKTKIVEFVFVNPDNQLCAVEAKTSAPNPNGLTPEKFKEYIADIRDKFHYSIDQLFAAAMKRREDMWKLLPQSFHSLQWKQVEFILFLVIKNHEKAWLPPISEALKKELRPVFHSWNISDANLKVINEQIARDKFHLIQ